MTDVVAGGGAHVPAGTPDIAALPGDPSPNVACGWPGTASPPPAPSPVSDFTLASRGLDLPEMDEARDTYLHGIMFEAGVNSFTVVMYVDPPRTREIDQGLILDQVFFYAIDQSLLAFVLTPTCDIAQQKTDFVQVCAAWEAEEVLRGFREGQWKNSLSKEDGSPLVAPLSKNKRQWLEGQIRSIVGERFPRWHWLAPIPGTSRPLILDFQLVQSVSWEDLGGVQVVAELDSPYREQVPARYAAYMGRVGTPDHDPDDVRIWVEGEIQGLFPNPPVT